MAVDDKKPWPERSKTDESLRTERAKTDRALTEGQASVEEDADAVIRRARETADAVLETARDKADEQLNETSPKRGVRAVVAEERALEDEALRDERASADEILQRERDEDAQALSRLLPLEREKTDKYLLTERVRSDDALASRDDFLSIVSHDLRSLLGGIAISAAMLAKRAPGNDEGARTVVETNRIHRYVARMNRLIGDLLDVGSIDAGKLAVTPTPGNLASLITEAVDTFQAAAAAKAISLESKLGSDGLLTDFDHDRMLQVLTNLITNSIKFTPEGGRIWFGCERAGDALCLSLYDTGPGIPSKMLETIFERFWQVGKNDRRGLGLGLYISKCIVEAHRGKIWAESKLGEGSTFCIMLPSVSKGGSVRNP